MINETELKQLCDLVRAAAGEELCARFNVVGADIKTDGSLITAADIAMQRRLGTELVRIWPAFALLGEEMSAEQQQALLNSSRRGLWCLDPLDGTSNFAAGIPFFAVSLALLGDGQVQAAVVYDPMRDECFSALRGLGAWLNGKRLSVAHAPSTLRECMAMVDLKRLPPALIKALAERSPYRSQRSFGSVALDWCWMASGRCQLYLHGGQKLWDYAAGRLVARESGVQGGVLSAFEDQQWFEQLALGPRIAIAATDARLLADWRAWLREALA
ncbi:MAG: inositol monophosphatase [Chromatiaceae bacterium]|nr:inositol monophosphatase [Gammaproteobacteria bacterium]MCP5313135.1 inositol monophosphatase [Chromatiaceae bacterium]